MSSLLAPLTRPVVPIRALCLHGFRTNADLMKMQTMAFRNSFAPEEIELRFLEGPRRTDVPYDPLLERLVSAPFFEWFNTIEEGGALRYEGLDEAVAKVQKVINTEGPFDVLVGFSQGGILATLLTALLEHPQALAAHTAGGDEGQPSQAQQQLSGSSAKSSSNPSSPPSSPPLPSSLAKPLPSPLACIGDLTPPWKCVVLVSAMIPRDIPRHTCLPPTLLSPGEDDFQSGDEGGGGSQHTTGNARRGGVGGIVGVDGVFERSFVGGLRTPSVHVFGTNDPMHHKSKELARWWADARRTGSGSVEQKSSEPTPCEGGEHGSSSSSNNSGGSGVVPSQQQQPPSLLPPRVLEVEHTAGHRFPTGKDARNQYTTIADAVRFWCVVKAPVGPSL
mmetsp:Transcript_75507/g.147859  ORF Transcript_75507/g.147859 Transcript_75507/m.147859 type:complete len:391 (-) Transcript_75507:113-1285(-)